MAEGRFWWQEERFADDIQVALDQVNEARRRGKVRIRGWELDACKDCFGSLNRIWSTLYRLPKDDESALPPVRAVIRVRSVDVSAEYTSL